ncbi:MAG TPA: STAS domain-containing protein, partial [Ramlibacter sp.]|nr:STAS domain-containing protein [Ramlibacter sp.]
MQQASSFTPIATQSGSQDSGWAASLLGALNASAFTIPLSLGAVAVVYARHAPSMLPAAVLATLLAIVLVQISGLGSGRPILYSARFLEATTLAALLDAVAARLPTWGITDSPEVRIAALVGIVTGAALVVAVLYLVRADRFARYIPTPVFAGFSNSIAVALLLSQSATLVRLVREPGASVWTVAAVTFVVFGAGVAIRRWLPRWPATATGVVLGMLLGAGLVGGGLPVAMVGTLGQAWTLPVLHADFGAFLAPEVPLSTLAGLLMAHASVLGAVVFLNTILTSQLMTHQDDRPAAAVGRSMAATLAMVAGGLSGGVAVSGSAQASLAGSRYARLGLGAQAWVVLLILAVALSNILGWVPLAALAGALLCEAAFMVDRESLRLLGEWLRRRPLSASARENLALVAAVTGSAVLVNMVAAVFAGLLLGLVLFAARNARRPVRAVLTGSQISSNCARSRTDLARLARHGEELRVLQLEGDLFFGAVQSLERHFGRTLQEARCVVLDWSGVRHVDTSVAESVHKFRRAATVHGIPLFHVRPGADAADVAGTLRLGQAAGVAEDLDHALEEAENHLLRLYGSEAEASAAALDVLSLFRGLQDEERRLLEEQMPQRQFRTGEVVMAAG